MKVWVIRLPTRTGSQAAVGVERTVHVCQVIPPPVHDFGGTDFRPWRDGKLDPAPGLSGNLLGAVTPAGVGVTAVARAERRQARSVAIQSQRKGSQPLSGGGIQKGGQVPSAETLDCAG